MQRCVLGADIMAGESSVKSVRGMNDLLPGQIETWQRVEAAVRSILSLRLPGDSRTPIVERTELSQIHREQTDIVEKEMYTFADNNGDSLTLRPEATASCVRRAMSMVCFTTRHSGFGMSGRCFDMNVRKRPLSTVSSVWNRSLGLGGIGHRSRGYRVGGAALALSWHQGPDSRD